jgi:ABC-type spermidine/putrescine transport system permease subunit II
MEAAPTEDQGRQSSRRSIAIAAAVLVIAVPLGIWAALRPGEPGLRIPPP